ncbi:hypothetical protein HJC23_011559 [Cyclotella cryptica]|uniref:O-methyltransferase domain-containing protein n=1 Tax=Cyclotella cryptica TaxID=29204 RepID=A0ABD3P173_9STRA|eukprot:CCRYP_018431-RA/>CCRYP_018431-RA protein AED:0.08 eAED:0.08 QI:0/-1/0/1/-1/1/1/0/434
MMVLSAAFGIASITRVHQRTCCSNGISHNRRTNQSPFRLKPINNNVIGDDSSQTVHPSVAEAGLLQLVQSHFVAQTLLAVVRLGVPDVLDSTRAMVVDEIIAHLENPHSINRDALFRCLRLLCTTGVIRETTVSFEGSLQVAFLLTDMGKLLQTSHSESMASFVLHWMEAPLWNAWSHLSDYLAGNQVDSTFDGVAIPPFNTANGVMASEYYSNNENSKLHRNAVARYASSREIPAILDAIRSNISPHINESILSGKTIVDVGGGYGNLLVELKECIKTVGACYCLDLPDVIQDTKVVTATDAVKFVQGNMFDHETIPACDVIFTKHVLCDFSDEDVVRALESFHRVLCPSGKLVIMDAVLPNGENLNGNWNAAVSFDVLLMLSGRRGERSSLEWCNLAHEAGFVLEEVVSTSSVTVDLAIFQKWDNFSAQAIV